MKTLTIELPIMTIQRDIEKQFAKVNEERLEVFEELVNGNYPAMQEECADMMQALVNLMALLSAKTKIPIRQTIDQTIIKNYQRGYYGDVLHVQAGQAD